MGKGLHRLGAFAFAHPWRVIAVWVVIITGLGFSAAHFYKAPSSNISIPNTEAQRAIDRLGALFPNSGVGSGRLVFKAHNNKTIADLKPQITALSDTVSHVEGVSQVVSPFTNAQFISKSGDIAYTQVQLDKAFGSIDNKTYADVDAAVAAARSSDLQVELGGDLVNQVPGDILGVGEIVGVGLALLVLLLTLGSLIAAGMPIVTALIAVAATTAGLFSLSQVLDINSTTPVMAIMLGLAVGMDYSLFIVNRYRTYVLDGYDYKDAVGRAIGTAGNAVIFAALTVVIALSALSVVGVPFLTVMGLTGAAAVATAALVAITLIPALLRFAGPRVFTRGTRKKVVASQGQKGAVAPVSGKIWLAWGKVVTARPWVTLLIAIPVIAALAWPVGHLKLGLATAEYASPEKTERRAYDLLTEGFGAGFNGPLVVVVEGLPKVSAADEEAVRQPAMAQYEKQVAEATAQAQTEFQQALANAQTPAERAALQQQAAAQQAEGQQQQQAALAQIDATVKQYAKYVELKKVADGLAKLGDVQQALPALVLDNGTAGAIQITPKSGPSADETASLIDKIRDPATRRQVTSNTNVTFAVTGTTAMQEDINSKLSAALPKYLAIIVGLSLLLLLVAFRSILVPIKATLGYLLSVAAMFGAIVMVFQWGWLGITNEPGPIMGFIAILATGLLFGLAMDYEFFLVSSMHEAYEHDAMHPKEAVVSGFGIGSKVVTAAAAIMTSVFAGFISNGEVSIQVIGFGLAVGVFVDAYIVRMTIVPAVMTLLGKAAWWLPRWLDELLPHVSIEGEDAPRKS